MNKKIDDGGSAFPFSGTGWWGYIHTNGTLQVKRFLDRRDIEEAHESPFVRVVFGPWSVDGHEAALQRLKECAVNSGWRQSNDG